MQLAVNRDRRARDVTRRIGKKKCDHARERHGRDPTREVRFGLARAIGRCVDGARQDRVDPHAVRENFRGDALHEREARRLRREFDGPVQRGITAAEHDQSLTVQQVRIPYAIADVLAFESIRALETDAPWLERADARRKHDRTCIECSPRRGAQQEASVFALRQLRDLLPEMELRVEGLDLRHQPVDQSLGAANGQGGNVVNRLLGIQLGALTAGMCEGIDQMRCDSQQTELENLEQTARTGPDDDDLRFDDGGGCGLAQGDDYALEKGGDYSTACGRAVPRLVPESFP